MTTLKSILSSYLEEIGGLSPATLGPTAAPVPGSEQHQKLIIRLQKHAASTRPLIILVTVLHCVVFGLALFLMLKSQSTTAGVGVGVGAMGSLLLVLNRLQRLWREYVGTYTLLEILPNMLPDDAAKVVQSVYFSKSLPKRDGRSAQ